MVFVHGLNSNAQFWWANGNPACQMAYANPHRTAFISFNEDSSNNAETIAVHAGLVSRADEISLFQLAPDLTNTSQRHKSRQECRLGTQSACATRGIQCP